MASCEKCWDDAYVRMLSNPAKRQSEHYHDLIQERNDSPCTAEEQAGENALICPVCKRATVHQIIKQCVLCGFDAGNKPQ